MKRVTIDIDDELKKSIEKMAEEKKWSFSKTGYLLLQQAVYEKLRKRKRDRKDHS